MKKAEGIFRELYRFDKKSGAYIIEIALDKYSDIFSEWDPAPFKLRDIDHDLELYLEGCSDDIPYRYPLILSFTIPMGARDEIIEEQARKGLRNGFKFKIYFIRKEIARTNARTLLFMLIGFAFLWAATIFPKQLASSVFPSLLVEGLFIGGWVFLWEAITLALFTTTGLSHSSRVYKRLLNSTIVFREVIQDP
ncbi:MAG: hypothetical protein GX267_16015 [Fibrobacter sp.]|jgi:hypothetical protein|nr:hypothetical protein [Fibrobacter sp.]